MKGIVKFEEPKDESFIKDNIKDSYFNKSEISVLLRVPRAANSASEIDEYSPNKIYSTIEEEFIKSGFKVRDRQLFNELISANKQTIAQLSHGTETDLILEIVDLDLKVKYKTDHFFKKSSGAKKFLKNGVIKLNGARVKFKIYSIKMNELVGTVEFNYPPCQNGCDYKIDKDGTLYYYKNGNYVRLKDYQLIETNSLQEFIKYIAKDLIKKLK